MRWLQVIIPFVAQVPSIAGAEPIPIARALARPADQVTVLVGVSHVGLKRTLGDDHTLDLRTWTSTAFPTSTLYPVAIGKNAPAARTVVIGGRVVGQQSRALTWREMKEKLDGAGLLAFGSADDWLVVDGARYENMMDDLRPRGVARFVFRHIWSRHTRDDAIENDEVIGGLIEDCLFEGAFMFLSEQNGIWQGGYALELSHVLARLEPMPYDTAVSRNGAPGKPPADGSLVAGKAHGQLFKHFDTTGDTPLEVHDCVFFVSQLSVNGPKAMAFPPNATWRNNVLIWAGGGSYPGTLPASGVSEMNLLTHSRAALEACWDQAVTTWKQRHGVTSFEEVDMERFIAPDDPVRGQRKLSVRLPDASGVVSISTDPR